MAEGLQIFDENGVNTLDSSSGTVKVLGRFGYSPQVQTFTNPLLQKGTPFFIILPSITYNTPSLQVSFDGANCSVYNTQTKRFIFIGVY